MRRFIIRTGAFAAIVVLTLGGICVLEIVAEIRAYGSECVAPAAATVAVVGDSQAAMAVDSDHNPRFFNFAAHGRTLDQSWLSLMDVVAANPGRIRTVLVDVTPANAGGPFETGIADMGYAAQYYLLHLLHRRENLRDLRGVLGVMRDNMVGRRLRKFFRALRGKQEFRSSLCGGFTPDTPVLSKLNPIGYRAMIRERADVVERALPIASDSTLFRILDGVVALRAAGVEVVLVTTPWCDELRAACDQGRLEGLFRQLGAFAASRGIRYLNFFETSFEADCWRDGHHLNAKGAWEFTRRLQTALAER